MKILGYLGPAGSFSEEAALIYNQDNEFQERPLPSIRSVVEAVGLGQIEVGVIPFENFLDGSINQTFDSLARLEGIYLIAEINLPIKQNLIAGQRLPLSQVEVLISHPEALAQCEGWIRSHLPNLKERRQASSTAEAVRLIGRYRPQGRVAAIGSSVAARIYGRQIISSEIQDSEDNQTRFVVVSKRSETKSTSQDRTSVLLSLPDQPGALCRVLEVFKKRSINLTMIVSRPDRKKMGGYIFFLDLLGHEADSSISGALREGKKLAHLIILGSYPQVKSPTKQRRSLCKSS